MKWILLASVILVGISAKNAASSRIASLKKHVQQSQKATTMALSGFDKNAQEGEITVRVQLKPTGADEVKLPKRGIWSKIDKFSPVAQLDFIEWRSASGGLVFRNKQNEQTRCVASSGQKDAKESLVVNFECKPASKTSSRFAQIKYDASPSWTACDGHVPFGWQTQWGTWDYPYYTVTTQGILGCRTTDADFCTPQNADLFPFAPTFDWGNYVRNPASVYTKTNGKPLTLDE